MEQISLRAFSRTPGGRVASDGPANGEEFRDRILAPALRRGRVIVLLDDVAGLPVSFLEEAFGGLVRKHRMPEAFLRDQMKIVAVKSRFGRYVPLIWQYITEESNRSRVGSELLGAA